MPTRPTVSDPRRPSVAPRTAPVCEPLEGRQLLAADLVATEVVGRFPDDLVSGQRGRIPALGVHVNNAGDTNVRDSIVLRLFASTDGVQDPSDVLLTEQTSRLNLTAGRSRRMPIRPFPTVAEMGANNYRLIAVVDATNVVPEDNEQNNFVASSGTIAIGPPTVNLTATDLSGQARLVRGRPARMSLAVLNSGNVTARGTATVSVSFTPLGQTTPTASADVPVRVNVRSRRDGVLRGRALIPAGLTPGDYTVTATILNTVGFTDANPADNSDTDGPVTIR